MPCDQSLRQRLYYDWGRCEVKRIDLAALGELLIDFTPSGAEYTFTAHPGGAPANVLVMAAKAGCKTAFIGKVGEDQFGTLLVNTLRQNGVETGAILRSRIHTTLAFVHLAPNGDRSFTFCRNHSADTLLEPGELDTALLQSCKVLHVGSLSLTDEPARSATLEAIQIAKEAGAFISYDPNWRPALWDDVEHAKQMMMLPLNQVDFMKLSDNEVELLTPYPDEVQGADWLLRQGMKLVVVTMGPKGCYYKTAETSGYVSAPNVQVVDTTGSGDVFTGALLSRLIRNGFDLHPDGLPELMRFACTAGSLCATQYGGIPAIPEEEEITRFLAQQ